jgi:hypothetical protein
MVEVLVSSIQADRWLIHLTSTTNPLLLSRQFIARMTASPIEVNMLQLYGYNGSALGLLSVVLTNSESPYLLL